MKALEQNHRQLQQLGRGADARLGAAVEGRLDVQVHEQVVLARQHGAVFLQTVEQSEERGPEDGAHLVVLDGGAGHERVLLVRVLVVVPQEQHHAAGQPPADVPVLVPGAPHVHHLLAAEHHQDPRHARRALQGRARTQPAQAGAPGDLADDGLGLSV
eukprot:CAMPEP_0116897994 /NCGR_PEP_ID=MMETSP0467-20121206/6810_1 /TAXON_ID=283647 /ORGANISM="Mesodinium pulex, Strain SPMC105" /LENGTH=157 /DNA_ID=CAMNT_0004569865 /DNA_START=421 /DNA_END=895 /DNA_ORIENTATION=+